jgi:hypothetical protein
VGVIDGTLGRGVEVLSLRGATVVDVLGIDEVVVGGLVVVVVYVGICGGSGDGLGPDDEKCDAWEPCDEET